MWAEPAPLLRAGLYWPGHTLPSLDDITREWHGDAGVVPIVFYRALVQSGNTAPVDALAQALTARRLRPLPVFVQSLKDAEAAALLTDLFAAHPPSVILNATGFSVAASGGSDPLQADCAILQGFSESWQISGPVYVAIGQIGNSVAPPVAYHLARSISEALFSTF